MACSRMATGLQGAGGKIKVADRLGFEPKTALQLYGISSAAPSTGLGHLSVEESLGAGQAAIAMWPGGRMPTAGHGSCQVIRNRGLTPIAFVPSTCCFRP